MRNSEIISNISIAKKTKSILKRKKKTFKNRNPVSNFRFKKKDKRKVHFNSKVEIKIVQTEFSSFKKRGSGKGCLHGKCTIF